MKKIIEKIKNSENYVIMSVGDSITYGTGSNPRHSENITDPVDELTYTAYFARLLGEKLGDKTVIRRDGYYTFDDELGYVHITSYGDPVAVQEGGKGKITVVRSGIGGNTVARLIKRKDDFLNKTFENKVADLFIIKSGINDSLYHIDGEGAKHAEPDEFQANFEKLVELIKEANENADIILMTPTVNDEHTSDEWVGKSQLDRYAVRTFAVAKKYSLPVIDLHKQWMAHLDKNAPNHGSGDWLTAREGDYCHPSAKGHEAIANEMIKTMFED